MTSDKFCMATSLMFLLVLLAMFSSMALRTAINRFDWPTGRDAIKSLTHNHIALRISHQDFGDPDLKLSDMFAKSRTAD